MWSLGLIDDLLHTGVSADQAQRLGVLALVGHVPLQGHDTPLDGDVDVVLAQRTGLA